MCEMRGSTAAILAATPEQSLSAIKQEATLAALQRADAVCDAHRAKWVNPSIAAKPLPDCELACSLAAQAIRNLAKDVE